jgi:CRP/FNR family transcriptional regulator, cyclic AMP receptor protein
VLPEALPRAISVLKSDPDLGAGISSAEWELAAAASVAPAVDLEPGPWKFFPPPQRGALGALVLGGTIMIRIETTGRAHVEIIGEGDVISPWVGEGHDLTVPSAVTSSVLSPLRVALLDRRFALRTARWPEIQAGIIQRLIARARRLSLQAAINAIPRVEPRLEATLWAMANQFGRMTREGVVLNIPLTHQRLAEILGAQRPSVSLALGRLRAEEHVLRVRGGAWLLCGEPPQILTSLERQTRLLV